MLCVSSSAASTLLVVTQRHRAPYTNGFCLRRAIGKKSAEFRVLRVCVPIPLATRKHHHRRRRPVQRG